MRPKESSKASSDSSQSSSFAVSTNRCFWGVLASFGLVMEAMLERLRAMSSNEEKQEIEVTPEMIEAGAFLLLDYFEDLNLNMARRIAASTAYSILQGEVALKPDLETLKNHLSA